MEKNNANRIISIDRVHQGEHETRVSLVLGKGVQVCGRVTGSSVPALLKHPGVTHPAFKVPADIGAGQKEGPSLCW